jgi:putative phosphoesterase
MRIAALYDIHGNLPALEAAMAEIRQANVDLIVVGGDVIPGPMPRETMDTLLNLDIPAKFILGNGDEEVLSQRRGIETGKVPEAVRHLVAWTAEQLSPEHEAAISQWPLTFTIEVDGIGKVLFCHASPRNNTEVFTRLTSENALKPVFAGVDAALVVCGHTHMQFERELLGIRLVNAGSVGMPYGAGGANWLLLGERLDFHRTSYDYRAAAEAIRRTSYPQAEELAANNILKVPSEEEALEVFTKMGLQE